MIPLTKALRDLDQIKADDDLKQRTLQSVMKKQTSKHTSYKIAGAILTAACCCLLFLFNQTDKSEEEIPPVVATKEIYSYVSVDINPSLEFQLDKEDKVINIVAYNKDADAILKDADIKGKSVSEAFDWLLSNTRIQEYMDSGYMQVSVYSEDSDRSLLLEQEIDTSLSQRYNASQYGCSCASSNAHAEASEHHMSFGKYQAIDLIQQLDSSYSLDDLNAMSMREIVTLYEQLSGQAYTQTHLGEGEHHGQGNNAQGSGQGYGNGGQGQGNGAGHGNGNGYGQGNHHAE